MKKTKIATEKLWAKNKYDVMAKGYQYYTQTKTLFSQAVCTTDHLEIYLYIKSVRERPYTTKGMVTTCEHLWGYFKRTALPDEKQIFFSLLEKLKGDEQVEISTSSLDIQNILTFLMNLTEKYDQPYLKSSTILFPERPWNEIVMKKKTYMITSEFYGVD